MDDRDQYVRECAEYLRGLAQQDDQLFSADETDAVLLRLERVEKALKSAELDMNALAIRQAGGDLDAQGASPRKLAKARTHAIEALVSVQQSIEDVKRYRREVKPRQNRLKRSAVNLAAAYFERPTRKPVMALAYKILCEAGWDSDLNHETVKKWIAQFKRDNIG